MEVSDGNLTVGNATFSGNYNSGGKYINIGGRIASQSKGKLNVSVSTYNHLFAKPDPDGYVTISKLNVTVSDKQGALKINNNTTLKVKKNLRNTAYVGCGIIVGGVTYGTLSPYVIRIIDKYGNMGFEPVIP
mgnify:CR=1 FL=1